MNTRITSLILAAFAVSTLGGCIVERQVVREEPQATLPAPPPAPSDEADAQPAPVPAPEPGDQVDREVFVERLSPYGHWEFVPDYGQVWVPAVAYGWRPYWDGHWVLTEWGWTFVSDDPWGWATYHYGRWGFSAGVGWFWVPGTVWGPAWVSWRYGGGYCAWAPLGPHGYVYGYSSPAWVAVRQEHFTQPIVRYGVADVRHTAPIVQRAQALPAPRSRPAPGTHFGPPVGTVSAATGQQLHPVRAATVVPRPAPVAAPVASAGRSGGARSAPAQATPRARSSAPSSGPSAPSSSPPASAPSQPGSSSGRSQSAPPARAAPHAAPAHGGSTYRMETGTPPSSGPRPSGGFTAPRVGGATAMPAPSGGVRYGRGAVPRAAPGHAPAARGTPHTR